MCSCYQNFQLAYLTKGGLCRAEQMQKLGFELDDEAAEWLKSFNEVKAYQGLMGHSCPGPLTTGASFLLSNW